MVGHVHPEERCMHTGHPHTGVSVLTTHVHTGTGVHTLATRVYTRVQGCVHSPHVYTQVYMCFTCAQIWVYTRSRRVCTPRYRGACTH